MIQEIVAVKENQELIPYAGRLICENGRAGIAAVTLDVVTTAKLLNLIVLALAAGQRAFALEFWREKSQNKFGIVASP
jgi:hypothetical protein